jgi:Cysteine dioxygenase type I
MSSTTTLTRRPRLDADALADIASALLSARRIWQGFARFDAAERQPVRLIADETFEAWVIGWTAGQGLELHDHGESAGAIVVAEGRLQETTRASEGLVVHSLDRGLVRRVRPQTVHGVTNLDHRAATSIHVYSPPLSQMTHFDSTGTHALRTVSVDSETPVLPTAVAKLVRIGRRI